MAGKRLCMKLHLERALALWYNSWSCMSGRRVILLMVGVYIGRVNVCFMVRLILITLLCHCTATMLK